MNTLLLDEQHSGKTQVNRYENVKPLRTLMQQEMMQASVVPSETTRRAKLQSHNDQHNANTRLPQLSDVIPVAQPTVTTVFLWTHAQRCVHVIFCRCFYIYFFMAALVGQTAERIFTKLSFVVDIRCYLRTY